MLLYVGFIIIIKNINMNNFLDGQIIFLGNLRRWIPANIGVEETPIVCPVSLPKLTGKNTAIKMSVKASIRD